ncbi:MAG: tRNA pseudouridine(55) synthase TruB [Kiritimatiellae bacterium]|nr:tRNA pseudouridine(55) synthase TruB [Kiritimatiellia bacterium]MCO5067163.1 tRNA pseudouridine(55) synthase TruB [Kiritimatiellia bacterium]
MDGIGAAQIHWRMRPQRYRRPPPRAVDELDGLLLVDKPAGPTSHDIVDAVRRIFNLPKVGHGGTLDPGATGLLILLLGRATKLSQAVMSTDKVYEGSLVLGVTTDTHDAEGAVLERRESAAVTREQLAAEFRKWVGDVEQVPPMVSAIKKDGVALYKMARHGKEVPREPRLLHIFDFALLNFAAPLAQFRVVCSKGTYVRTLCHDVGEGLGCGACMNTLHRVRSGTWDVKDAVRFEDLVELDRAGLAARVLPLTSVNLRVP